MKEWYNKLKEWYNKNKKIINIILTLIFSVFIILTAIYIYNQYTIYEIKKPINDFIMRNTLFNGGTKPEFVKILNNIRNDTGNIVINLEPYNNKSMNHIVFDILFKIHKAPYEILFVRSNDGSNITYFMCFRSIFTLGFWYYYSHTDTDNLYNKFIHIELQSFFTSHVNKTNIIIFNELLDFMRMNDLDILNRMEQIRKPETIQLEGINPYLIQIYKDFKKLIPVTDIPFHNIAEIIKSNNVYIKYTYNTLNLELDIMSYSTIINDNNNRFIYYVYKIGGSPNILPSKNFISPICIIPEQDNPIMCDGRYSKYNAQFMQPFIKITDIDDVETMLSKGGIKIGENYVFVGNMVTKKNENNNNNQ